MITAFVIKELSATNLMTKRFLRAAFVRSAFDY